MDTIIDRLLGLFFGVLQGVIIAGIVALAAKQFLTQIFISVKMKNHGFRSVRTSSLLNHEAKEIFSKASVIKILYVSGHNFLMKFGRFFELANNRETPPTILYLLADPHSKFLDDIQSMEVKYGNRMENEDINEDIENAIRTIYSLNRKNKLLVRHFSTQYRLPVIIAEFEHADYIETKVWLTLSLPPYKSKESIILCGSARSDESNHATPNFVDMSQAYFDTIWDAGTKTLEQPEYAGNNE